MQTQSKEVDVRLPESPMPGRLPSPMPAPIKPNLASATDAARFLEYYRQAIEFGPGRLALFVLPDRLSFVSNDISELAEYAVTKAEGGKDVYFHIHLHELSHGESFARGQIATAASAIGLFADVDARGPGRRKPSDTLCSSVEDAVWVVQQFNKVFAPLSTSGLIMSGYGCYPFILLKEPFPLDSPEARSQVESMGRRFHSALDRIASERGWTGAVDYCDLAKVLRLPGCTNWKDPSAPKLVVLDAETPARFNLTELEEILPQIENRRRVFSAGTPDMTGAADVQIALDSAADVPSELLSAMAENHPLFAATWGNRRDDLRDQSASGYDLALASIGISCGLTDQQIADLLVQHRREFPGNKQDRRGQAYVRYLERTISLARQGRESSEAAERQQAELAAAISGAAVEGGNGDPGGCERTCGSDSTDATRSSESHQPDAAGASAGVPAAQPGGLRSATSAGIEFLVAQVRKNGDVAVVYDNVTTLAKLSDAQLAVAYQQLKKELGTRLNRQDFDRAIKEARGHIKSTKAPTAVQDARPIIWTTDRFLDENAVHAIAALEAANEPPVVFRRGGRLVMIQPDEDDTPIIVPATEPMMRGRLARVARFLKETKQGSIRVSPPQDLTLDVLNSNAGSFPPLGVVTQTPILRSDGSLRLEAGYDPATRAYYHPNRDFRLGRIPDAPSWCDLKAAVELLDEAIGEFPFEAPPDKANSIALMLTPILKLAFRMKTPLALIDAPKWGTGKTLLAMVVYVINSGGEGTVCTAPANEEEWRKRVTSILERGSAVVILDNVDQTLRSPSLSAVLTSPVWEDRLLGKSEDVRLPNVSTWIATGNNLVLGGEMARRGYRIRLDAKVSNPSGRTAFKRIDQELLDWTAAHRGELVGALLAMIRGWWAAGQPKADVPAFGSFNRWARIAGGILSHAGVTGFLANLESVQRDADEESLQWEQFLRALLVTFQGRDFTTAEIVDHAAHNRGLLSYSFPDEIGHPDERGNEGAASLQRRMGKALSRKCGTRFGELELRIEKSTPDSHTKTQRWRVEGNVDSVLHDQAKSAAGFHGDN